MKKLLIYLSITSLATFNTGVLVFCFMNGSEKADLSTIGEEDRILTPEINTKTAAEREAVKKIKDLFNIYIIKLKDYKEEFQFTNGLDDQFGQISIISLDKSTKIKGSIIFKTVKVIEKQKKYLMNIKNKDLGEITEIEELPIIERAIAKINDLNDDYNLTIDDVDFIDAPSLVSATIQAKELSNNYLGRTNVYYNYKQEEFSVKNLNDIKKENLTVFEKDKAIAIQEAKNAVFTQIKKVLLIDLKELQDIKFTDYNKPNKFGNKGSIKVSAYSNSLKTKGDATFTINYHGEIYKKKNLSEEIKNELITPPLNVESDIKKYVLNL
ncbi:hypothetical protein SHELI_v1c03240 [Spiroplasma helicoides]|uniref:Uncharacterized protein n=1 Tax=Spiroplasma helicoides TaxID=216938 RepID=A0A1B3SK21_9MOLU|nr:hypothetical protein [Spiroplasma helicoides]AOG60279.1 hypothetical protein SHELI_v1c03240 [Spiroplasma helicoides]